MHGGVKKHETRIICSVSTYNLQYYVNPAGLSLRSTSLIILNKFDLRDFFHKLSVLYMRCQYINKKNYEQIFLMSKSKVD